MTECHIVLWNEEFIYQALFGIRSCGFSKIRITFNNSDMFTKKEVSRFVDDYRDERIEINEMDKVNVMDIRQTQLSATPLNDWVFILDGDEIWENDLVKEFLTLPEKNPVNYFFACCKTKKPDGSFTLQKPVKLFKKTSSVRWTRKFPREMLVDEAGTISAKRKDIFYDPRYIYDHLRHFKQSKWRELPEFAYHKNTK